MVNVLNPNRKSDDNDMQKKKKTLAKQNHKAQLKDNQMLKEKIKFFVF